MEFVVNVQAASGAHEGEMVAHATKASLADAISVTDSLTWDQCITILGAADATHLVMSVECEDADNCLYSRSIELADLNPSPAVRQPS